MSKDSTGSPYMSEAEFKGEGALSFSGGGEQPCMAKIYASHYHRLMAVLAAARTGDCLLITLAVENADKFGTGDIPV
jgi:hypothetical protein